ncbi:MAG: 50S ribosomal protein L29 [Proteobacteria bacterium]|nr:50S ribosomal protein L29 [Pseudomonadota bacterium]|tara:strand:+ start:1282 stop:1497 length:216 start_codon:yes stop_codon:yes gene_type:complete
MDAIELRKKSPSELKKELEASCKAFFSHKMQISMQQSNNTAKLKEHKRSIARVRTIIREQVSSIKKNKKEI